MSFVNENIQTENTEFLRPYGPRPDDALGRFCVGVASAGTREVVGVDKTLLSLNVAQQAMQKAGVRTGEQE